MSPRAGRSRVLTVAARVVALSPLAIFSSAVMPQDTPGPKLPYGLSCSQCMLDERTNCAALPKAELVVDTRQMERIDERRECDSAQTCRVTVASRSGSVFVLRSPKSSASTTIFLSQFSEPTQTGVRLMPDTRLRAVQQTNFMERALQGAVACAGSVPGSGVAGCDARLIALLRAPLFQLPRKRAPMHSEPSRRL